MDCGISVLSISPSNVVVVVLPFDPVTAIIGEAQNQDAISSSENIGIPLERNSRTIFDWLDIPGLRTTRSASNTLSEC